VVEDEVAVVIEREVALLTPEVRSSADQLEELLDPDFEEIGKSGHLWTRGEMIAALVADTDPEEPSIKVSDTSGRTVGPGIVLLTYVTQVEGRRAPQLSMGTVDEGVAGSCTTRAPPLRSGPRTEHGRTPITALSAAFGPSRSGAATERR
jgi:hypothetical protein